MFNFSYSNNQTNNPFKNSHKSKGFEKQFESKLNFFKNSQPNNFSRERNEQSNEKEHIPIISSRNLFSKFQSKKSPKDYSGETVMNSQYEVDPELQQSERRMAFSKKNSEENNKNGKSSDPFYKRALKGDKLGQKARNNFRTGGHSGFSRSDSNDSIHSNSSNFGKNSFQSSGNSFMNNSKSNKENQGFRANQLNRKIFESNEMVEKANFNNMSNSKSNIPKLNLSYLNVGASSKVSLLHDRHMKEMTKGKNPFTSKNQYNTAK